MSWFKFGSRWQFAKTFILVAFVVLGSLYSLVTPIFEASDERWHYPVVDYIAHHFDLPVQDPDHPAAWHQEGSQPPLYYMLASVVTLGVGAGDLAEWQQPNPHAIVGLPLEVGNKNMMIHSARENWPWHGTALAVHLIRLLSVLLGAATVWLTWSIAELVCPNVAWVPVLAAALTAFNPMFIFISASVNNDNLAAPLAAAIILLLLRISRRPQGQNLRDGLWLGLLLALGALTKLSVLAVAPLVVAVLTWDAARRRRWSVWALNGLIMAAIVLVVAGWWYWRNWTLYGDPTGISRMLDLAGRRHEPFTLARLWAEFQGLRISYWAQFGALNILVSDWIYTVLDVLTALGLLGGLLGLAACWLKAGSAAFKSFLSKRCLAEPFGLGLLLIWIGLVLISLLRWTTQTYATQGRLMFVAIAGISTVLAMGLLTWSPPRLRSAVTGAVGGGLLALAALVPFVFIAPAYAPPPLLTRADLPADMQTVNWDIDGKMRLVGYRLALEPPNDTPPTVRPAESLPITIYWQALAPMEEDYSVFVHLLGRERAVVGQVNTYPGLGAWPTSKLQVGDIVADTYHVPVAADAQAPTLLRVHAGLYRYSEPGRPALPAATAEGTPVEPWLTTVRLIPWVWPPADPTHPTAVRFGDNIFLAGYDLETDGDARTLTLYWQPDARPAADYTVFVQLWTGEQQVAGFDSQPVYGYYPTNWWTAGETIVDQHSLALDPASPAGGQLRVGLYALDTGARLPAIGPEGPLPDNALVIELEN